MKRVIPLSFLLAASSAFAQTSATALAAARIISPGATIMPISTASPAAAVIEVETGAQHLRFAVAARGRDMAAEVIAPHGVNVRNVNAPSISITTSEAAAASRAVLVTIHNR